MRVLSCVLVAVRCGAVVGDAGRVVAIVDYEGAVAGVIAQGVVDLAEGKAAQRSVVAGATAYQFSVAIGDGRCSQGGGKVEPRVPVAYVPHTSGRNGTVATVEDIIEVVPYPIAVAGRAGCFSHLVGRFVLVVAPTGCPVAKPGIDRRRVELVAITLLVRSPVEESGSDHYLVPVVVVLAVQVQFEGGKFGVCSVGSLVCYAEVEQVTGVLQEVIAKGIIYSPEGHTQGGEGRCVGTGQIGVGLPGVGKVYAAGIVVFFGDLPGPGALVVTRSGSHLDDVLIGFGVTLDHVVGDVAQVLKQWGTGSGSVDTIAMVDVQHGQVVDGVGQGVVELDVVTGVVPAAGQVVSCPFVNDRTAVVEVAVTAPVKGAV